MLVAKTIFLKCVPKERTDRANLLWCKLSIELILDPCDRAFGNVVCCDDSMTDILVDETQLRMWVHHWAWALVVDAVSPISEPDQVRPHWSKLKSGRGAGHHAMIIQRSNGKQEQFFRIY